MRLAVNHRIDFLLALTSSEPSDSFDLLVSSVFLKNCIGTRKLLTLLFTRMERTALRFGQVLLSLMEICIKQMAESQIA